MNSRAYRATRVNDVKWDEIARGREGLGITLGVDVGKWPAPRFLVHLIRETALNIQMRICVYHFVR